MKITINKNVISQNIEEDKILLNLETSKYHSLNQYGLIIWDFIDNEESVTFESIVKNINKDFEVDSNLIDDIKKYLKKLHSLKLVIIEDE